MSDISFLLVAGGRGLRMGTDLPKQYIELEGKPIFIHTLLNLRSLSPESDFTLVIPKGDKELVFTLLQEYQLSGVKIAFGGNSRAESVYNGLMHTQRCYVAVHDAVRPFVSAKLLDNLFAAISNRPSVIPAVSSTDSVRLLLDSGNNQVVDRDKVLMIQTPQCFSRDILLQAYEAYFSSPINALTDDASIVEHYMSLPPMIVQGDYDNIKITTPKDLAIASFLLSNK